MKSMARQQHESVPGALLDAPSFTQGQLQADGSWLLDLNDPKVVQNRSVDIVIPPYAECDIGDRVALSFQRGNLHASFPYPEQVFRYLYLEQAAIPGPIQFQPLQALEEGHYEVSYMVTSRLGNASPSKTVRVEVVHTPPLPWAIGQQALYGVFPQGEVAAWVVPETYAPSPLDVLFKIIANRSSTAGAQLGIYRVPAGQQQAQEPAFATLKSGDGAHWTCNGPDVLQFQPGDLVSVRLESPASAAIYLALAL